jgi:hypothetical protein
VAKRKAAMSEHAKALRFMRAIRETMEARSGDVLRWSAVRDVDMLKWFSGCDNVTEACDRAEADSLEPDHVSDIDEVDA